MKLFKKRSRARTLAGVYMDSRHLAVATVEQEKGRPPRLIQADWHELSDDLDPARLLRETIDSGRTPVNLALNSDQYQFLLVEAPRVEPSELRAAVRWKIKNLIDFHIDDAVIDVFEIPGQQSRPQGQAMMYTIAARAREIRSQVDLFDHADLSLQFIDVTEMALRNLAAWQEEDVGGIGTLLLDETSGLIALTHQGSLYLSRRFDIGSGALTAGEGTIGQLVLEIQRSLDYYDSHFSQPPLSTLHVLPGFEGHAQLVTGLGEELGVTVAGYDTDSVLDCEVYVDGQAPAALYLAIGAALRREEVSL